MKMEQIKQALNKVFQMNNVFLELYDIIDNLKLTADERKEILEYLVDIDTAMAELETRLEEADLKEEKIIKEE